ncbi:maleylpyruvate isomerase N-terminal domain-containing protein [Amycolatopsis sp. NPDC049252]|uniref:maleylpyruvate isomerase N-terminal domain-containing protein n=1 Tax=Amycolatopsis sp. NPDC049252 TaxID=3363933 RepID=UPI00371BEF8A
MDLFSRSWTALRKTVAALPDEDFAKPSGCRGWLVRDLVCHLVIDAQDVLITLVTPSEAEPTADAITYWKVAETPPTGDDPLDALIVRLAAAYEDPALLKVLTAGDYLSAYVLEWTLHHLDLPGEVRPPGLAHTREMLEKIAGAAFPASFTDTDVLLVGTGRRAPTEAETAALGDLAARLPFVLG